MRARLLVVIGIETVFHAISVTVSAAAVEGGWAYEVNSLYYAVGDWLRFGTVTWMIMASITLLYYRLGAWPLVYTIAATKAANALWDLTVFFQLNTLDPALFQCSTLAIILALSLYYSGREVKSIAKIGKKA